jgi:hypothetical protein
MRHDTTYAFNITGDTASYGGKRFQLVIRQDPALAMHLLNFTAKKVTHGSQITWLTEHEQNYTHFTVERSTDGGRIFNVLGGMASYGAGTYDLWDIAPVPGANMYRLKIEDLNSTISYSNVVTLMYANTEVLAKSSISLYPNPTKGVINLNIRPLNSTSQNTGQIIGTGINSAQITTVYQIRIYSAKGLLIQKAGTAQTQWQSDLSHLLPGSYMMEVLDNNGNLVGQSSFVKL